MNPARRTLDPRAKLYLLLVANLMLFFHVAVSYTHLTLPTKA